MTIEFQNALRFAYRCDGMRAAWALVEHHRSECPIQCPRCEGEGTWCDGSVGGYIMIYCSGCGGSGELEI